MSDFTKIAIMHSLIELLEEKDIKKSSWGAGRDLDVEDLKEKSMILKIAKKFSKACG